jgi:hypothetical protein
VGSPLGESLVYDLRYRVSNRREEIPMKRLVLTLTGCVFILGCGAAEPWDIVTRLFVSVNASSDSRAPAPRPNTAFRTFRFRLL